MALVKTVFETKLKSIFAEMQDGSKTDAWMAEQIATAIQTYVSSGQVTTTDSGAAPAGSYAGAGVGIMEIDKNDVEEDVIDEEEIEEDVLDEDNLGSKLTNTFESEYNNDDLAAHIATDIDDVCKADDTVTTTSSGTVTTPSGATSPFSGTGKGKFSGVKTTIETTLKTCFATMNNMSQGGDDYLAVQLASAVDAYLKAGAVNIDLQAPFVSGAGSGGLS